MSNPAFENYTKELNAIYIALVEQTKDDPQEPYFGGKDSQGIPHGNGKMHLSNGGFYEGSFNHGVKNGIGKFQFPNDDPKKRKNYEGEWLNDEINGKGILIYSTRSKFEGNFNNNLQYGFGIMYFSNGDRYEGNWNKDKQEGTGVYFWSNSDRYDGNWKNNVRDGKGLFCRNGVSQEEDWKDGVLQSGSGSFTISGGRYDGEMREGKRHGKGTYYYPENDPNRIQYAGEWKNDMREGSGTLIWKNNENYVGHWKNDKRNGFGILFHIGIKIFEAEWLDGRKNGHGIEYNSENREHFRGNFKDDKYFTGKKGDSLNYIEGEWDSKGNCIYGQEIYNSGTAGSRLEVRNNRYTGGTIWNSHGKYEGTVDGDDELVGYSLANGYSTGYGNLYGEIKNGKLNGNGRKRYDTLIESWNVSGKGLVIEIEGFFIDGKPSGECMITLENGTQMRGEGDGTGKLKTYNDEY